MLKFFVRRPVTTLMFVLFWVVLGFVSFPNMNIERTPPVDLPMVSATFIYPGATPAEIESQVVKRAEDAISQVSEIKKMTSLAFENGGYVMTEFNLGVNVNEKSSEVKSKLDALLTQFPSDMELPVVEPLDLLQESVVDIVISGADARAVEEYVENVLSNKITAISGIASVSTFGGQTRAVRVQMNPESMAARGATIMDIVSALASRNLNVPGGKIETSTNSSSVRFIGEFASIDEIADLRITTLEGQSFTVADIANVYDSARDIETGARYNSENVVIASVVKASDGNAIKISDALNRRLPAFQAELADAFPGAEMQIVSDSSIAIADETQSTINGIILGVIFTLFVLLAFTRNWRSTIIAGVVIPASLIAGFFFMDGSGFSINAMTLLAYSSALGTLVANAIVLIESALQEMHRGKSPEDAAVDGTKKVAVSVLAGVGTNVVVFLPLAFMGGIVGQFMIQFGLTVVYLTLLSLMFSFTLTPMMIAKFLRLVKPKSRGKRAAAETAPTVMSDKGPLGRWFNYQYVHSGRVILMAVAVLFGSVMLTGFIGNEFSPSTDANEITITARAPMGATYDKSESIAMQIEDVLGGFDEVVSTTVKIGDRGLQNMSIKVELVDIDDRNVSDKELARKMLPLLSQIPDAEIQVRAGQAMSSAETADLVLQITGPDDTTRDGFANIAQSLINDIPEVQTAVFSQQAPNNERRFIPDGDLMKFWGMQNSYAGATLRTALYGNDDYKYKEDGEEYPIILELAPAFKNAQIFDNIYVNSQKGMVVLSDVGSVENFVATSDISRINKERVTEMKINIGKSTMGPVQADIEAALATIDWEYGYGYQFGGMSETQDEANNEIGMAFLLATILTFMLLAAILNSIGHPFTIATSILTSFAGVFVMLFLSGATMNIGAMLAFVMLVGLVVNNNILLLEPTVVRVANGEDARAALWTELSDKRKMIIMTSVAIVMGMLPQMWSADGMKSSMAAVLIGGMLASLVWTFVLTPALFFAVERIRNRFKRNSK